MKPLQIILTLLLLVGIASGETLLVKTGEKIWTEMEFSSLQELPIGVPIIRISGVVSNPNPNPDPDPNPDPNPTPDGNTVQQIKKISGELITNKIEATGLLAVIRLLSGSDADPVKIENGLKVAVEQLAASPLFPNNSFQEWYGRVAPLANRNFSKQFLNDLNQGVTQGTNHLSVTKTADLLVLGAEGDSFTEAAAEKLNIAGILQLIQFIFQLLRDLGILD